VQQQTARSSSSGVSDAISIIKTQYWTHQSWIIILVPPDNCDVAERNFRATLADFGRCFGANNLPFWGKILGKLDGLDL